MHPIGPAVQRFLPPEREMPDHAVFISYAREDLAAVQKLKSGLDAAGVKTWFDLERLESGDDYDRKIQRNISRCSFFIPVVSANTERRLEAYFRREWSYAIDRTRSMADGAVFILPFVLWFSLSQQMMGQGVAVELIPKVSEYLTLVTTSTTTRVVSGDEWRSYLAGPPYGVAENAIFLPGNNNPQYCQWLAFSGTSVTLDRQAARPRAPKPIESSQSSRLSR